MKKIRNNSKKGFTLVELIVVLVILAVMAAMLVPALTGYIDEARKKKDYNAASEVLTAAQSLVARYYGDTAAGSATADGAAAYIEANEAELTRLTGVTVDINDDTTVCNNNLVITHLEVSFDDGNNYYTWDGTKWS